MHCHYDAQQTLPPERSANRLFLKEAGAQFVGSQRDEAFVEAVADILERDSNLKAFGPFSTHARQCVAEGLAVPLSSGIQRVRSESAFDVALLCPGDLASCAVKFK